MPLLEDNADKLIGLMNAEGPGTVNALGTVTTAQTLSAPSQGAVTTATLGGNVTINLPTPQAGARLRLYLTQDGTGSRTVTWATPSGSIKWQGAAAPTLTITAGHTDRIDFESDGTNWYGMATLNYN